MGLLRRLAQNGPPAGFQRPSGITRQPPGFTPPAGMTGPPPELFGSLTSVPPTATTSGISVSSTRIPVGFNIPSGATGPPPGFTPPSGMAGSPSGMMPPGVASPVGGSGPPKLIDEHSRNDMIGVTTMLLILCLTTVGGRLFSRRIVKQKFGTDDFFALGALLLFIALCVSQYLLVHHGTGASMTSPSKRTVMGQIELSCQLTYIFVMTAARLSILFLYKRVFNLRTLWFRAAWWFCVSLVSLYSIIFLILSLTQCAPHPVSNLWKDRSQCRFRRPPVIAMGFINAAIDLTILILPIRMTWDLQMAKKQKIAVSSVFGLGLIGVAVSLARATRIASPKLFIEGLSTFAIWSTTEPAVALICACLPVMRPVFIAVAKFMPSGNSWSSWTRTFRGRKSKSTSDTSSTKTLTDNSVSTRGLNEEFHRGSFNKPTYGIEMRGNSFNKQGYSKVETHTEAKEIKSPLPIYSPWSKSNE
ncbi:MAG: hypothetical protein Q9217_001698 [Psora testacea]